ncbi:thioredoxin-like protein [Lipomyces oligophaga]|uniref:thioredoxin-like protein n=1 Tax=Lipomyces oligophaga TaxID=45792 RepID=UPI0034CF85DC
MQNNMDDEEKLSNFCAITDTTPDRAQQYLDVCDGDIDRAVNLFLETGGSSLDVGASSGSSRANAITLDDEGEDVNAQTELADSELAERLQREENERSTVRERIAPREETLVEDYGFQYQPRPRVPRGPPGIFNQSTDFSTDGLTDTQSRLGQLFRPPFDIISSYDFDSAKTKGREQKKWILVNIQDLADFRCQMLNRDFWSSEAVKETVRENFIFLQYSSDDFDGQNFLQYYPTTEFPYIAILDPRTGEEMKRWTQLPTPEDWVPSVHEFLDRFSLDPKSRNPIGKIAKHKEFDRMTEEEQINFALQQSLGVDDNDDASSEVASEMSSVSAEVSEDESNQGTEAVKEKPVEVIDLEEDESMADAELNSEDTFATIMPVSRDEPPSDPKTTTRVQIRLGDGSRRVRRFNISDPVRFLFEYVKAEVPEMDGKYFQIISSDRKKLIDIANLTIEDAGLKNASVLVEADDD